MSAVGSELEILAAMYLAAAADFLVPFLAAVVIAALLTTFRLDRRIVPFFQRAGLWSYVGALLLGLASPF